MINFNLYVSDKDVCKAIIFYIYISLTDNIIIYHDNNKQYEMYNRKLEEHAVSMQLDNGKQRQYNTKIKQTHSKPISAHQH